MSTKLQQVIAKSRLSTLDGELRKAGEQMLRDKFFKKDKDTKIDRDILEALQRKSRSPFDDILRLNEERVKTTYSFGDNIVLLEITVAAPNYGCLMEALRRINNQSDGRRVHSAQIIVNPAFYSCLVYECGTTIAKLSYRLMSLGFKVVVSDLEPKCKITMEVDR